MDKRIYVSALMLIVMGLWGCAMHGQRRTLYTHITPIKQKVKVRILLDSQNFSGHNIKKEIINKAEGLGIDNVAKIWLNKSLIFVGSMETSRTSKKRLYNRIDKNFTPFLEKNLKVYKQGFWFEALLDPVRENSGVISGVEGGYSLATNHILISLYGDIPEGGEAFFIVARKNSFKVGDYYQLIGVGKIYNIVGRMAQGELLTSNEEISTGDAVFLLSTRLYPVTKPLSFKEGLKKEESLPVVKVHPVIEPMQGENAPGEMK